MSSAIVEISCVLKYKKMSSSVDLEYRDMAFNRRMLTFAVVNREHIDVKDFLLDAYHHFESEITDLLNVHPLIKVSTCFSATFEKIITPNVAESATNRDENDPDLDENGVGRQEEKKEKQTLYIHTKNITIDSQVDLLNNFMENVVETVVRKVDDAIMRGSGFTLSSINELLVQVNRYDPLRGSSYMELPKKLTKKKAIVNVQNSDELCFKWAVLSALYPAVRNAQRLSNYLRYKDELNFSGIEFPMKVRYIEKFERQNPTISINVYIYDEKLDKVQPLRVTKEVKRCHIHLLLLTTSSSNEDENDSKSHYCWIKNLSRLISNQISRHNGRQFYCDCCLNHFQSLDQLEIHRINCRTQNVCAIEMPTEENDIVEFKNIKNQVELPFILYADVEALLKEPTKEFCKKGRKKKGGEEGGGGRRDCCLSGA